MKPDNATPAPDWKASAADITGGSETQVRHLASIVESTDDAVIGKSLDGTIQSWNQGAARLYGYADEEVLGKSISVLVPDDRMDEFRDIMARLMRGERIYHLETVRLAKDGRRIEVELTISPIQDANRVAIGASTIARDIGWRKQFERALRESEARNASILEVALDCIITIDGEGHIIEWNPAAERTFLYSRDEVMGQPIAETIIPPALRERHYTGLTHYQETGEGPILRRRQELIGMRKGGEQFPVEITIAPITVGGRTLFTAYLRDITERQRAEQAQQELALLVAGARCLLWYADVTETSGYWLHWDLHFADEAAALRNFPIYVAPGQDFAAAWHLSRVAEDRIRDDRSALEHVRAGQNYSQEFRCVRWDGAVFWIKEDVQVTVTAPGQWHLFGVSTEITTRIQAEQDRERLLTEAEARADQEALVNRIGLAIRSSLDPDAVQETAASALAETMHVDRCYFSLFDLSNDTVAITHDYHRDGLSSIRGQYPISDFRSLIEEAQASKGTQVISDIRAGGYGDTTEAAMARLRIRACLRLPLFHDGELLAVLVVAMTEPRVWTSEEVALVEAVGAQTRVAVENARLHRETEGAALRQRTFLRDVLASVTEGRLNLVDTPNQLPLPLTPMGEAIRLSLTGGLRELRHQAHDAALAAGMLSERVHDLLIAVGESSMNAVTHAGTGQGQVFVGAEGLIQVRIEDQGEGISLENLPKATLARGFSTKHTLGHGFKMMLQTVDRVFLLTGDTGTTVVLEQELLAPLAVW